MKIKGFGLALLLLVLSSCNNKSVSAISHRLKATESPKSILSRRLKNYSSSNNNCNNNCNNGTPFRSVPRGGSTEEEASATTTTATTSAAVQVETEDIILQEATTLRQQGKELHDQGDLLGAAELFAQASILLSIDDSVNNDDNNDAYLEDYCTCRLHEALCRLKLQNYDECIAVCTAILQLEQPNVAAAIRARAHHRRAKAYIGVGGYEEEALQDARAAAFLGDRKAVALYGKLMRGSTTDVGDDVASPPMLNDLLQGKNPFLASGAETSDAPSSDASSLLLNSLLGKSSPSPTATSATGMMGDMPSLLGQGGAGGTLAKSLLSSLTKRLENDSDSICTYLHKTNPTQIQQLGSMAGLPISAGQAKRLSSFCHNVTPKAIRRTVKYSKRGWYGITVLRKSWKVVNKYKPILILWFLAAWIQAALRRPIPLSKEARKKLTAAAVAAARK